MNTPNSLDEALALAGHLQNVVARRERQIEAMRRASEALFLQPGSDALMHQTLGVALEALDASSGSLQIYDAEHDALVFQCVVGPSAQRLTGHRTPASQGIGGQVLRTGVPDITRHVRQHGGHNPLVEASEGETPEGETDRAATMITVPLKRRSGDALGVMQLLKASSGTDDDDFDNSDLEVLHVLCGAVAAAIEATRLAQQARRAEVISIIGEISHDIKNMLTPIQSGLLVFEPMLDDAFAELDALGESGREAACILTMARENYAWIFEASHTACDHVIERTREIADAVKGDMAAPFFEEADINATVGQVARSLALVAEKTNVHLHFDLGQDLPRAEFDRKQIYNALYNLVNNAIPETPDGGSVTVRTRTQGDELLLEVEDTGGGIPEYVRARLFTDDAISTKDGGTGLGTRIVAGVVRRHHGTISVQSEIGKGSTFSIRLPLRHKCQVSELVTPASLPVRSHNLPASSSLFIGRERERDKARALLARAETRLMTLTGPAGTGKTQLALRIAEDALGEFEGGAWFVSLAPLSPREGSERVVAAIAATLGVREEPGLPLLESLKDWLSARRLLLLLDNFEHILAAAPLVADLLSACAGLTVLVTSRAALHLRGESELSVPPLELPALPLPGRLSESEIEALGHFAAIALFLDRAAQVKPDFALSPENACDIVEICARLDGLPLAIELAAVHIKTLTPPAMLARLESRLSALEHGPQDAPLRHQTLRAALDWSYDLLHPGEQKLFTRLMVFESGWSAQAAAAVAGVDLDFDIWRGMELLANKSLIQQGEQPGEGARFFVLQTIREYGLGKLEQNGEVAEVRRRHALYYLGLAEAACAVILRESDSPERDDLPSTDPLSPVWRQWREAEYDNLRAALGWLLDDANTGAAPHGALRMALSLREIWNGSSWTERRQALERALEQNPDAPDDLRLRAMLFAGDLANLQAEPERAADWARQSLEAGRQRNEPWLIGRSLGILANAAVQQGDLDGARELHLQSLALFRDSNSVGSVVWGLYYLGEVAARAGDKTEAQEFFEQCLETAQSYGDKHGAAFARYQLGKAFYERGDVARALPMLEESLSTFAERGHQSGIAFVLCVLGKVAHRQGDFGLARERLEESLATARLQGNRTHACEALRALGDVALDEGDLVAARDSLRQSLTLCKSPANKPRSPEILGSFARLAALLGQAERAARLLGALADDNSARSPSALDASTLARGVLGETAFAQILAQGRALTPQEATDEAFRV